MNNLLKYAVGIIDSWRNKGTFESVSVGWKEQAAIIALSDRIVSLEGDGRAQGDLSPCPICGGNPYFQEYKSGHAHPKISWMVICRDCRSGHGALSTTQEGAQALWDLWPRWRRNALPENGVARKLLDERIRNQRSRLRYFEQYVDEHMHAHKQHARPIYLHKYLEQLKISNAQAETISALEREVSGLQTYAGEKSNQYVAAMKENAELRKALEPFAKEADKWPIGRASDEYRVKISLATKIMASAFTVGDLRRARLASTERTEG